MVTHQYNWKLICSAIYFLVMEIRLISERNWNTHLIVHRPSDPSNQF